MTFGSKQCALWATSEASLSALRPLQLRIKGHSGTPERYSWKK